MESKTKNIGKRINELRNTLKLSQPEFGEKIGVGRAAIGLYENGKRNVTDRVISDIIREYNVNYEWLTNGEGEMFIESNDELYAIVDRVMQGDNEYHKFLMKQLASLTDEQLETVRQLINIFQESNKE